MEAIVSQEISVMLRIIFAMILGIFIGSEREKMGKPAGMRTHSLVCMSSAAIVAVSMAAFPVPDSGARAISAVLTGIGFLGAGQIMTSGGKVSSCVTGAASGVSSGQAFSPFEAYIDSHFPRASCLISSGAVLNASRFAVT